MLRFMRKRSRSIVIQIGFGIIIIVFIFWGIGGFSSKGSNIVARVDDTIISQKTFLNAYQAQIDFYKRLYGDAKAGEMLEKLNVKEGVLNNLIDRVLMVKKAREMGLGVTNDELIKRVESIPAFKINGVFSKRRYVQILRRQGLTPGEFESSFRDDILIEKLKDLINDSVKVTDDEARMLFNTRYRKINLRYLTLKARSFEKGVSFKDSDVESYYNSHKAIFKLPRMIDIDYIVVDPTNFLKGIKISNQEIDRYYKENPDRFKKTQKNSDKQEILPLKDVKDKIVKLLREAKAQERAKKKANDIVDRAIRQSMSLKDIATKEGIVVKSTGLISEGTRGELIGALSKAAFSLRLNEISDPIDVGGKLYILQLTNEVDEHVPEFKKVKKKAELLYIQEKARDEAKKVAQEILATLRDGKKDLTALSKERGIRLKETGFFSRLNPSIPGIRLPLNVVEKEIFTLNKKGRFAMIDGGDRFFIVELIGTKLPSDKDFEKRANILKEQLLRLKREELFQRWLQELRRNADIKINRKAI